MPPSFIYFDLGNVLLNFDHHIAARQMAEVAGLSPEAVWKVVFEGDLEQRAETGLISTREVYEEFCQRTGTSPDFGKLQEAGNAIFEVNVPIVSLVATLKSAGNRLGVLSNTSESHWSYVSSGRYGILRDAFDVFVLSYEVGAMKPDAKIYQAAAEAAGAAPEEIFFTDDLAENVAGARAAGFDAVQFSGPVELARELRLRGVRFNY